MLLLSLLHDLSVSFYGSLMLYFNINKLIVQSILSQIYCDFLKDVHAGSYETEFKYNAQYSLYFSLLMIFDMNVQCISMRLGINDLTSP